MKKKIIGIFVCMLLIATALPTTSIMAVETEKETQIVKYLTIMFARGKVENISNETINDIECYNCTAVDVKVLFIHCIFLMPVGLQREHLENFDCFYIPKEMFRGILREGFVFGIIQWWGE